MITLVPSSPFTFGPGVMIAPVRRSRVRGAPEFAPLPLKFVAENFGAPFPGQAGLLQLQLAHLHVVAAGDQQDRFLIRVQLHLPADPVPVKVGVPPALFTLGLGLGLGVAAPSGSHERDAKVPLILIV